MTNDEAQTWDFFRTKTSHEIRGCFPSNLWERLVLQIAHEEPSIRHAAIAVGSMHRMYKEREISTNLTTVKDPYEVFSLRQYVKAIGSLRTRLKNTGDARTREVSLITCLLFICLEMLRGQRVEALTHLQTGLRILLDSASRAGDEDPDSRQLNLRHHPEALIHNLTTVFVRLDYESTMFGVHSPYLHVIPEQNESKASNLIPATFFDIAEARQYLDSMSNAVFRFRAELIDKANILIPEITRHPDVGSRILIQYATARALNLSVCPELLARQRVLQSGLAVWLSALSAYRSRNETLFAHEDVRAMMLLEVQQFYLWFLMTNSQTTREMSCDSYNDDFERVVSLATQYLIVDPSAASTFEGSSPLFTLESGVLPSLYLVGMKCRKPSLRRRAISLIDHAACQEGMWEGSQVARFLESIASMEETASCSVELLINSSQIPEWARFSDIVLALSEDPRYGRLICARYRHESDGLLYCWEEKFRLKR